MMRAFLWTPFLNSKNKEESIMLFLCYPRCGTCQKAREWLDAKKLSYTFRDIVQDPPPSMHKGRASPGGVFPGGFVLSPLDSKPA